MCYAVFTLTFRVWLPTFVVATNLYEKEEASLLISALSVILIILIVISLFVKINIVSFLRFIINNSLYYTPVLFIFYLFNLEKAMVIISIIYFGFITCLLKPFLITLPSEFHLQLTSDNMSKMSTSYAIGESLLTFAVGYLI